MSDILYVLIPIFMIAALVVVLLGVLNLARGGDAGRQRSNKLMQLRVMFQLVAVLLMGALFFAVAG